MAQLHPVTVIYVHRGVRSNGICSLTAKATMFEHADPALILCLGLGTLSGLMDGNVAMG